MTIFRGTPEEIAALKIGDVLFNFNGNRRVYNQPKSGGYASGGPIYEKHFAEATIVGETKNSWVMSLYETKVNKKTLQSSTKYADHGYFTKSGMEADIWLHEHRYRIAKLVESAGVEQLKEIARIVDYGT